MSGLSTSSKICSRCGQEKSLSEYHRDKSKKDGHVSTCKECRSEYKKNNSDIRVYNRHYKARNRKTVAAYQKQYRKDNAVHIRLQEQEYKRRKHRQNKMSWRGFCGARWSRLNHRTINGSSPRWDCDSACHYLKKGVRLEMTYAEFRDWCETQKDVIERMYRDAEELKDNGLRPSLDRIDPDGHYSISNIQILSWSDNCRLSRRGN